PPQLLERYPEEVAEHGLRREIMCTQVANDIVNRLGFNFVPRQRKATGAPVADVARAYTAVMHIYAVDELWARVEALDYTVDAAVQQTMMHCLMRLVRRASRWLLRNRRHEMAPTRAIAEFAEGVAQLREALPTMLRGRAAEQYRAMSEHWQQAGVDASLAEAVAGALQGYTALGIVQAARETEAPLMHVAELYFEMGERLQLDWFSGQILASKVENEWQALARDTYLEDLEWQQRTLAVGALRYLTADGSLDGCLQTWEEQQAALLSRWQDMVTELHTTDSPDFAMFAVAVRELLDLAQSSLRT
ncbi:MAG TPA: NAD-glutamate dehydrogenase, partial [Halieaceae bacterium]|nr:NAD-glutamate dehydrogenase [Halieaceae bacterium]